MNGKREADGTTIILISSGCHFYHIRHLCRLETCLSVILRRLIWAVTDVDSVGQIFLILQDGCAIMIGQRLYKVTQPCLMLHGEYDAIIAKNAVLSRDSLPNAELHS